MTIPHPAPADLEAFARGRHSELSKAGCLAVLRHLLAGCLPCREQIAALAPLPRHGRKTATDPAESAAYDAAIDRASRLAHAGVRILLEEKERAPAALAAQLDRRDGWEEDSPQAGPRRPALALCELLLETSFALRHKDPDAMVHLARLAKVAADNLDPARYGAALVADVQVRAAAELGNALRVADRLGEAEVALLHAARRIEEGTGDPLLLARLADLFASLYSTQRRFAAAFELLDRAHWLYLEMGDRHLAGRALISKGIYAGFAKEPEKALELLRLGLPFLDPERDPQLLATARQSLIAHLTDCGHFREARKLLLASGLRKSLAGDDLNLAKLRWLEGQIAAGVGRLTEAEKAFTEAREDFCRAKQGYNAALVGLDLSSLWLRQGRTAEIPPLVAEMVLTFSTLNIAREALGAVRVLQEACEREALTQELLDSVRSMLKTFEPGAPPSLG